MTQLDVLKPQLNDLENDIGFFNKQKTQVEEAYKIEYNKQSRNEYDLDQDITNVIHNYLKSDPSSRIPEQFIIIVQKMKDLLPIENAIKDDIQNRNGIKSQLDIDNNYLKLLKNNNKSQEDSLQYNISQKNLQYNEIDRITNNLRLSEERKAVDKKKHIDKYNELTDLIKENNRHLDDFYNEIIYLTECIQEGENNIREIDEAIAKKKTEIDKILEDITIEEFKTKKENLLRLFFSLNSVDEEIIESYLPTPERKAEIESRNSSILNDMRKEIDRYSTDIEKNEEKKQDIQTKIKELEDLIDPPVKKNDNEKLNKIKTVLRKGYKIQLRYMNLYNQKVLSDGIIIYIDDEGFLYKDLLDNTNKGLRWDDYILVNDNFKDSTSSETSNNLHQYKIFTISMIIENDENDENYENYEKKKEKIIFSEEIEEEPLLKSNITDLSKDYYYLRVNDIIKIEQMIRGVLTITQGTIINIIKPQKTEKQAKKGEYYRNKAKETTNVDPNLLHKRCKYIIQPNLSKKTHILDVNNLMYKEDEEFTKYGKYKIIEILRKSENNRKNNRDFVFVNVKEVITNMRWAIENSNFSVSDKKPVVNVPKEANVEFYRRFLNVNQILLCRIGDKEGYFESEFRISKKYDNEIELEHKKDGFDTWYGIVELKKIYNGEEEKQPIGVKNMHISKIYLNSSKGTNASDKTEPLTLPFKVPVNKIHNRDDRINFFRTNLRIGQNVQAKKYINNIIQEKMLKITKIQNDNVTFESHSGDTYEIHLNNIFGGDRIDSYNSLIESKLKSSGDIPNKDKARDKFIMINKVSLDDRKGLPVDRKGLLVDQKTVNKDFSYASAAIGSQNPTTTTTKTTTKTTTITPTATTGQSILDSSIDKYIREWYNTPDNSTKPGLITHVIKEMLLNVNFLAEKKLSDLEIVERLKIYLRTNSEIVKKYLETIPDKFMKDEDENKYISMLRQVQSATAPAPLTSTSTRNTPAPATSTRNTPATSTRNTPATTPATTTRNSPATSTRNPTKTTIIDWKSIISENYELKCITYKKVTTHKTPLPLFFNSPSTPPPTHATHTYTPADDMITINKIENDKITITKLSNNSQQEITFNDLFCDYDIFKLVKDKEKAIFVDIINVLEQGQTLTGNMYLCDKRRDICIYGTVNLIITDINYENQQIIFKYENSSKLSIQFDKLISSKKIFDEKINSLKSAKDYDSKKIRQKELKLKSELRTLNKELAEIESELGTLNKELAEIESDLRSYIFVTYITKTNPTIPQNEEQKSGVIITSSTELSPLSLQKIITTVDTGAEGTLFIDEVYQQVYVEVIKGNNPKKITFKFTHEDKEIQKNISPEDVIFDENIFKSISKKSTKKNSIYISRIFPPP